MHIKFECKSDGFLSDFDQISIPNPMISVPISSKSDSQLFEGGSGEANLSDFAQISFRFLFKIIQISDSNLIQNYFKLFHHHHTKKTDIAREMCQIYTSDLYGNL